MDEGGLMRHTFMAQTQRPTRAAPAVAYMTADMLFVLPAHAAVLRLDSALRCDTASATCALVGPAAW
jgi:hypothetical protein